MTSFSGMHHVGIVVQDIKASMAWYREHLGFEPLYEYGWPGVKAAFIGRGALRIELFQNEQAAPMAVERRRPETNLQVGGINHFAIEVVGLDATVKALEAKGVSIVSPPRDVPNSGGCRFAFIHDNEQMLVELFEQP
ncbi:MULTISPECIES: VOC family protein [Pseudomonas]|uniref:Bleomycin resistance protein n=1 Tax=Pseudomonas quercus TaxID=2722792 RepID=A0ABX0YEX2_9PSED|nr:MULTISPECIES: VOC family protein [Pseudomonas]MBF7142932.1 VOC family protein [Pseudomonas sp. LY10J]NJP01480.1 bleomycin resistance protein [Pseudomonas quercus]